MKAVVVSPERRDAIYFSLATCRFCEKQWAEIKYYASNEEDFDMFFKLQLLAENLQKLYHVA